MNSEVPLELVPPRPVMTPEALQLLTDDVGPEAARDFLRAYLRLLPSRADGIYNHLARGDLKGARKAVSSLQVTSTMAGALKLENYCQLLQQQLTLGSLPDADSARGALDENVTLLRTALRQLISTPAADRDGRR
jgi:HPt (histidine-containing phosphotransfer) domain-containing protein